MDFLDTKNIGKEYNGFVLLKIDDVTDFNAKGIFLRHKTTGMEIYHLFKNDKENLFAFAFRTVSKDSKGTAHIIEHSTLCGSEKYPLKEPFATLAAQSLNTFLNALTFPDKTVYPAASLVKNDYFNIMDVYADCVFFPKLDKSTFVQEAYRLEMDSDEKCSIQGVVYNEMKAMFSSFPTIAYNHLNDCMFPDSYPSYCSGGDPLEITSLTYEDFIAFHQKFYNPDNCMLFLYGDIPTSEQLDFLNKNLMPRIEKKYGCRQTVPYINQKTPYLKAEVQELLKINIHKESKNFDFIAPVTGSTGNMAAMSFYTGKYDMEKIYLNEVLCGIASSPVAKALKDSNLGDENILGNFGQYSEEYWSFGMSGVKEGNEKKIFSIVQKELLKLYEKGVSQKDIDAAVMGIDFNLREENRYWGPFSLGLMQRALKAWAWGKDCLSQLTPISDFEKVKEKIRSDKDYTKNLIKKYFLDNDTVIKVVVRPSDKYFSERQQKENENLKKMESLVNKQKLKEELKKLHEAQLKQETPQELSCIPHTRISELDKNIDCAHVELKSVKGADNSDIPLFVSEEETNGLFYVDLLFPFDTIDCKYFKHIPFLSNVITNLGWQNKKWDECIQESACIMGDVWGKIVTGSVYNNPECVEFAKKYKDYNFSGRKWLGISCEAITENAGKTFSMLSDIITGMDFKDKKRFKVLLQELIAEKKSGIINNGRDYISKRTTAAWSEGYALAEILWGVTQLKTISDYSRTNIKKLLKLYEYIYYECIKSGGIIHITADKKSLEKILPLVEGFAKDAGFTKLKPSNNYQLKDYIPHIYNYDNIKDKKFLEAIQIESNTGYAFCTIPASAYLTKESAAEIVYANWLGMHAFWDTFRTKGGCYGGGVLVDSGEQLCKMYTYRDPSPDKHADMFEDVLEQVSKTPISDEDVEKAIVSEYGNMIVPFTAKERGRSAFEGFIYANYGFRLKRVSDLLSVTTKEVNEAAGRFLKNAGEISHKAVFCDNSIKVCGNFLELPL